MTAVPARLEFVATVQDGHGDVAVVRFPSYLADITANATATSAWYTNAQALFASLAACINGKIVKESFNFSFNRAQKPAGPLDTYAHVYQAGEFFVGDGGLERARISIPTPLTSDFQADGITVNPADTNVAALISAVEAHCAGSSGGSLNEYLGGRFREGKPRRRTNLYNGTA